MGISRGQKNGQKWVKIACSRVNPPYNSKPRCPSCPCCDIMKVQHYAKQFKIKMKPEEMWGLCYGPKKRPKHAYNSGFLVFLDYHSTHNQLICLFLVHFSQEDSPACLHPFQWTMEGLWGSLEVKKWSKMVQNCIFLGKSTLHLKASVHLLPVASS